MSIAESQVAKLKNQIRNWVIFFMFGLVISGATAFPLENELNWLAAHSAWLPSSLSQWAGQTAQGLTQTNASFPFISYGTDWLAFAHIIIALLFIGVLRDPVRNIWIVEWAMLCCVLIVPLAFIAGPIRGIPFFHQLIDCSFGLIGIIPLLIVRGKILQLERQRAG